MHALLDGKFAPPAIFRQGFVYSAICTTADETNNVVFVAYTDFTGIPSSSRFSCIYVFFMSLALTLY